jgi:hypothetical protein
VFLSPPLLQIRCHTIWYGYITSNVKCYFHNDNVSLLPRTDVLEQDISLLFGRDLHAFCRLHRFSSGYIRFDWCALKATIAVSDCNDKM